LFYFDTSALVPAFIGEAATERVLALMAERGGEGIAISPWTLTEFSSALALKHRIGEIDDALLAAALAEWRVLADALQMLPIGEGAFREAAALCQRRDHGLRAGDALHLAVAAAHGAAMVTLDERLERAAAGLGVEVVRV